MPKIKTREVAEKGVKAIDKAAVASERMRDAFIRTKDKASNMMDDGYNSPSEYAGDQLSYMAEDTVRETGNAVSDGTKKAVRKGRDAYDRYREAHREEREAEKAKKQAERQKKRAEKKAKRTQKKAQKKEIKTRQSTTKQTTQRTTSNIRHTQRRTVKASQQTSKTIKQTAKSTGKATVKTAKGTVKTTQKTIKTAQQTSKAAIKTAEATAKAAKAAAQASAKAARAAAAAAKAAAKAAVAAAKIIAKATVAAVKAIIAAVKALIAAIAAGGWVAVVVIVVICLIALIVGCCFGIFFSSEDTGSSQTMQQVVQEINTDYQSQLDSIKTSNAHDELEMSGSRAVWPEVLSIYAVKMTTDPDNPQEVATMTDEKKAVLKEIFWEMNTISYSTTTEEVTVIIETDDGNGNIVEEEVIETVTTLHITVSHKTADDMAAAYGFNDDQKEQLAALLDEGNGSMWAAVLYGIYGEDDQIVAVALSQLGNVGGDPYWSWYGFGSRVEWCACFVSWCANECGYIEIGVIPKFAGCVNGVQWFRDRGQWADGSAEPAPGMIIFFDWDSPDGSSGPQDGLSDHVGIVERVENGRVYTVEGNSGDSCRQNSYPLGYYEILGYGIPAY
ncbi:CHAP domain-containing protein [Frisingicoccus sp.]